MIESALRKKEVIEKIGIKASMRLEVGMRTIVRVGNGLSKAFVVKGFCCLLL